MRKTILIPQGSKWFSCFTLTLFKDTLSQKRGRSRGLLQPPEPLNQRVSPSGLRIAETTYQDETTLFPLIPERNRKTLDVTLLARPLKAANPDAKHPGKAGKIPGGKLAFPWGLFLGFLWARSHQTFVSPGNRRMSFVFSIQVNSPGWVQGQAALVQGFRGLKKPPASYYLMNFLTFAGRSSLLIAPVLRAANT